MSLRHTVGELCMLAAGQHTLLLNEYHCKHGQHPCVYSTSMRLLHLYASTPPLCVYLTSMRLLHLYASTPPLCVYLTSMRLPHLYVSTPPLCVDPTSMCLHHLYLFNSAFNTWWIRQWNTFAVVSSQGLGCPTAERENFFRSIELSCVWIFLLEHHDVLHENQKANEDSWKFNWQYEKRTRVRTSMGLSTQYL